MVKEFIKNLSKKGATIKYQMERGLSNAQISRSLGIQESTIRYYRKRPDIKEIKRASKLPQKYLNIIYKLASNKTTREMPGGLIAVKINEKLKNDNILDKNGKLLTITKSQVNRILREKFGKPLKVRKVFYLNEEAKKKRLEFCQKIVQMGLEGKNIFFTDETRLDTGPNTKGESIRVSSKIKNKIKKGDEEGYQKINRETKKFESSIIVAGGVSYYGQSDLILLVGTMTDFAYVQALEFYKENYENFKKQNENLYFEQDGASCHTSKKVKALLENYFGDKLIQNAPHSPDIAYPIETLWAELKKRVKNRNPKSLEELKEITIEEWNKIPKDYIKKLFNNYIKRCNKIIELKGGRLEPEHLRDIRKEMEKKQKNEEKMEKIDGEKDNEEEKKQNLKLKLIYNKIELTKKAKKEVAYIRKKIKAKKRDLRKAEKAYNKAKRYSLKKRKIFEIMKDTLNSKTKRNIELENYKFKVNWINNYITKNIGEYFHYFKKECERQEREKTYASTMDGEIEYALKSKKEKIAIKKDRQFYTLEYHPKRKKQCKK